MLPFLGAGDRQALRALWAGFLDYLLALDGIARCYQRFDELDGAARPRARS